MLLVLVVFGFLQAVLCFNFNDNEIIGTPEILCQADTIDMQFKTKKPFTGKVFVKGNYNRPECRVDYGIRSADGRPVGGIRLNHGACNMDRQRMITPDGMLFSTVLIISFHPLFLTKMDKAYNIKCMYREVARTVQVNIDVDGLETESVSSDIPMPQCEYTIRKDSLDGEILKYARVGDQVVHRWQCDSNEYGVLVHSCVVEDGQGEKQQIIDENGCHTDRLLLGDPTYVENLNMAYRESFVFKFADRISVRFQCEIRLCLKEDGGCEGITPPICNENNIIATQHDSTVNSTNRARRSAIEPVKDGDLISQTLYVLDSEDPDSKAQGHAYTTQNKVCLAPSVLVPIFILFFVFLIVLVSLAFLCVRRTFMNTPHQHQMPKNVYF